MMQPDEYALAEYASLRAEILAQQTRRDLLLQGTVAAVWLVFVWLATSPAMHGAPRAVVVALWFLPAVIAAMALLKHLAVTRGVRHAAAHLAILQANAQSSLGAGWELRLMREGDEWGTARNELLPEQPSPSDADIIEQIMRNRRLRSLTKELRVGRFLGGGRFPRDVDKIILIATIAGALLIGLAATSLGAILIPLALLGMLGLLVTQLRNGPR